MNNKTNGETCTCIWFYCVWFINLGIRGDALEDELDLQPLHPGQKHSWKVFWNDKKTWSERMSNIKDCKYHSCGHESFVLTYTWTGVCWFSGFNGWRKEGDEERKEPYRGTEEPNETNGESRQSAPGENFIQKHHA